MHDLRFFHYEKYTPEPLPVQTIELIATKLLDTFGVILHTELNTVQYHQMHRILQATSNERNTYEEYRNDARTACKNAYIDKGLLAKPIKQHVVDLLALQTQFGKSLSPKGDPTVCSTGRASYCESYKRPISNGGEALDLLQQPSWCSAVWPRSRLPWGMVCRQKVSCSGVLRPFDWRIVRFAEAFGCRVQILSGSCALFGALLQDWCGRGHPVSDDKKALDEGATVAWNLALDRTRCCCYRS